MKKFVSWNVNGIRACLGKDFYKSFESLDADIFCLQETKMQEGQAELELPGYHQYWNYAEKKGYSGTAIFTKEEPIEVTYGIGIEEHDHEGRVITAEFKDYYFITVYVPNSQDGLKRLEYRMKWEDDFLDYIKELDKIKPVIYCGDLKESPSRYKSKPIIICGDLKESPSRYKSKPIIICGDLNVAATEIDLKNPKSNVKNPGFTFEEREKFQKLLNAGFTDSFRYLYPDKRDAYTWWSYRFNARKNNAGWRIDYFLVSDFAKDRIKDSKIHANILGSDHCPIELDFDL